MEYILDTVHKRSLLLWKMRKNAIWVTPQEAQSKEREGGGRLALDDLNEILCRLMEQGFISVDENEEVFICGVGLS